MSITMPNVPIAEGIPAVLRSEIFPYEEVTNTFAGISNTLKSLIDLREWGVFDQDGNLLAEAHSFVSLDVSDSAHIPSYPMETGGFISYNKVAAPSIHHIKMNHQGDVDSRSEFWRAIDEARQSIDLFNIVTPEVVYLDANITGVRREVSSTHGITLAVAEIELTEVRQSVTMRYSRELVDIGSVQAK